MKMVNCLPEFEYFTVFLKNRNFFSKIRISKVTDYAALKKTFTNITRRTPGKSQTNDSLVTKAFDDFCLCLRLRQI